MSKVFVLNTNQQPLNPVHPGKARILLSSGKAAVYRRFPFTIILKAALEQPKVEPLRIKIDPGANTTGIAIVNDASGRCSLPPTCNIAALLSAMPSHGAGLCAVAGGSGGPVIANPASLIVAPTRRAGFLPPCKAG